MLMSNRLQCRIALFAAMIYKVWKRGFLFGSLQAAMCIVSHLRAMKPMEL